MRRFTCEFCLEENIDEDRLFYMPPDGEEQDKYIGKKLAERSAAREKTKKAQRKVPKTPPPSTKTQEKVARKGKNAKTPR